MFSWTKEPLTSPEETATLACRSESSCSQLWKCSFSTFPFLSPSPPPFLKYFWHIYWVPGSEFYELVFLCVWLFIFTRSPMPQIRSVQSRCAQWKGLDSDSAHLGFLIMQTKFISQTIFSEKAYEAMISEALWGHKIVLHWGSTQQGCSTTNCVVLAYHFVTGVLKSCYSLSE